MAHSVATCAPCCETMCVSVDPLPGPTFTDVSHGQDGVTHTVPTLAPRCVTSTGLVAFLCARGEGQVSLIRILSDPALLVFAQSALGCSQEQLGRVAGVSRRTVTRWFSRGTTPTIPEWARIARAVYPKDRALSERIAKAMGESLITLGLEAPPPPPPPPAAVSPDPLPAGPPPRPFPPTNDLVDSIVCAAAEAIGSPPGSMRPALIAAFDRAVSLGLELEEVRSGLHRIREPTARSRSRSRSLPGRSR